VRHGDLVPSSAQSCAYGLEEGEAIALDLPGRAVIRSNGERLACDAIPDFLLEMVRAGGLLPQLKKNLQQRKEPS
jgi:3-isopropylmalate/(R)-2-methylmalate dehydratase small subunit